MKRLFLTVVAVLSMTMTFAEDEKLNNVESAKAYNMEVNYGKLADFPSVFLQTSLRLFRTFTLHSAQTC